MATVMSSTRSTSALLSRSVASSAIIANGSSAAGRATHGLPRPLTGGPRELDVVGRRNEAEVTADVLERGFVEPLIGGRAAVADEHEMEVAHVGGPRRRLDADVGGGPAADDRLDASDPQHGLERGPEEPVVAVLVHDDIVRAGLDLVPLGPPRPGDAGRSAAPASRGSPARPRHAVSVGSMPVP